MIETSEVMSLLKSTILENLTSGKETAHVHRHTATFKRCLKHLSAKGYDAGGQHRICYSSGAGYEGVKGASRLKAARKSGERPKVEKKTRR